MTSHELERLLHAVRDGRLAPAAAARKLRGAPFEDLGFAKVDTHRAVRCGFAEVVYCPGKTATRLAAIARTILARGHDLLATRAERAAYAAIRRVARDAQWHEDARCVTVRRHAEPPPPGFILVLSAGTSDVPVAEEARVTAESLGNQVKTLYDVGVAGIHRLLGQTALLQEANVLVVVAGMEGALASVVGGLVDRPVIGVPTSVGYGASFGGVAPLLTMLNSCAAGVSVVNIDNGFGAGYVASLINRVAKGHEGREHEGPRRTGTRRATKHGNTKGHEAREHEGPRSTGTRRATKDGNTKGHEGPRRH
ncbi:MAG: nickel pincer cofactor biosynthesis protein LarB [Planctomycetes bacterium]|nr:nickel pincer cofactor biosynthesis protein LarB [Planctomycetota bacterium]